MRGGGHDTSCERWLAVRRWGVGESQLVCERETEKAGTAPSRDGSMLFSARKSVKSMVTLPYSLPNGCTSRIMRTGAKGAVCVTYRLAGEKRGRGQ